MIEKKKRLITKEKSANHSYQLLEVVCCGLSDCVNVIDEPSHAEAVQLFVEKVDSELT